MQGRIQVWAVVVLAASLVAVCARGSNAASVSNVTPQDVVRITFRPYLLGKSPLVATRVPRLWRGSGTVISLRSVEKAIPDPLPDPPPQPVCRGIAQTLTVISRDGQRLVYGPCVFPDSIVHLARVMYRVALKGR